MINQERNILDEDHYWKEYDDQTEQEYYKFLEQGNKHVTDEETR